MLLKVGVAMMAVALTYTFVGVEIALVLRDKPDPALASQDALKPTRGTRARAARLLGTTERIIGYKIRMYGIDPGRFREDGRTGGRAVGGGAEPGQS